MEKLISRTSDKSTYDGWAAEDREENSTVLKVICPELMPNSASGTVGAGIATGSINLKDRDGNIITSPITMSNHIVATWGGESNQREPPMVRKGEPVQLYKKGNQDKFYWLPTAFGRDARTTDALHFEIAATDPSKPGVEKNDTNTYHVFADAKNKKVGFTTSDANGEVAAFSCVANLADGTFHLSDKNDKTPNRIFLDTGAVSGTPVIQLNVSTGAVIKIQGDDIYIKAPGKLMVDVGDRFILNSPLTIFNLSTAGTILINASNVTIKAAKDFIVTAGVIGLNGATKVGGVLVAAAARIASLVKGSAGGNYSGATISRPEDTPVSNASNSPDTTMSGSPYIT